VAEGTSIIRAGGGVNAIVPQSFEDAWRIAGALAASGMTPKDIGTQEKVLAVIMAGAEIGLAPFQSLQSFAIINGRPALWGDGMLGVARKYGVKVDERIEGQGDERVAICRVTRSDTEEVIERSFSVADAKQAKLWNKKGREGQDTPWVTYPMRMLQMRARAWALRDGCADMLRGMKMAEEVEDYTVESSEAIPEDKPFINGSKKDELVAIWNTSMRRATTPEELDDVMTLVANFNGRFSENTLDGLRAVYDQEHDRICAGEAPREPEPSPFDELKAEGLACLQAEDKDGALRKWLSRARSRTLLERCTSEERTELKTLEKGLKREIDGEPAK